MSKSSSSKRWLKEHFKDPFVKQAQKEGYRSRAAFKLMEIQERDHLFKPGMIVVDLGAAPGGWSQLATRWVGAKGQVFALDILMMDPLPGVEFMQGDFTDAVVLGKLMQRLGEQKADIVISDIAPNMSGIDAIDQPRSMYLAELVLDFAKQTLKKGGTLLLKAFQGTDYDAFLKQLRQSFAKVVVRKPKASRKLSNEVYLLAKGKV